MLPFFFCSAEHDRLVAGNVISIYNLACGASITFSDLLFSLAFITYDMHKNFEEDAN